MVSPSFFHFLVYFQMKILVISWYINLFRVCYPGRSYRVSLKKYMIKGLIKRGILHLNRAK